ncbi:MAG: tyrosine-type recombinase/integrase [Clostridia bacterium]|nr:tyrosine-type recombinase/integrase [Clostridia bacterium]
MTINNESIKMFEQYLINEEKSKATIEKYLRDVNKLRKFVNGQEITKIKMLEFKNKLMTECAPTSVNSIIAAVNSFLEFFKQHDLKIKSVKLQRKMFANKEKELTKAEYGKLLNAAKLKKNKRLYYLMQTICSTGIRVSEVKYVTVDAVKTGYVRINCKGKLRVVILPEELCKILHKYIKSCNINKGPVFVTKTGQPIDRSNIYHDMKKLCEDAHVDKEKVFPHNLRHLFARVYYSAEHDIVRLADILGHSNINTTRIYTIETGEVHRQQMGKLGLLRC